MKSATRKDRALLLPFGMEGLPTKNYIDRGGAEPMAFDTELADRIRKGLGKKAGITEKQQFGGVAFLVNGNVACGVIANDMLVRVGPENHEQAMVNKHAKAFSLTGRPSKGWVIVSRDGLKTAAELNRWVRLGMDFAASLPPK